MLRAAALLIGTALLGLSFGQVQGITFDVETFRITSAAGGERFAAVQEAVPGELIEYRIYATNTSDVILRPGTVVVTVPLDEGLTLVPGSVRTNEPARLAYSTDGEQFQPMTTTSPDRDTPSVVRFLRATFTEAFDTGQTSGIAYRVVVDPGNPLTAAPGAGPVPPPSQPQAASGSSTSGFTFERVRVLQASDAFVQVVGAIRSQIRHDVVLVRVTLNDRGNQILATDTFIVESVGPTARVFDTLLRGVDANDVADVEFQIETTY
jgi:uncharacterized repeat protein (TIGR01451 family)